MKKNIGKRMLISLDNLDTIDTELLKISKRVKGVKKNKLGQKKKIYREVTSPKVKEKKLKKTITMLPEKSIMLKTLSDEFKVPQGEVVEKLIEIVSDDYYKEKLDKKFRELFS